MYALGVCHISDNLENMGTLRDFLHYIKNLQHSGAYKNYYIFVGFYFIHSYEI
jgi:hypothetical protein